MPDPSTIESRATASRGIGDRGLTTGGAEARLQPISTMDVRGSSKGERAAKAFVPQGPLRVVFYQGFRDAPGSAPSFKAHADVIASNLGALKVEAGGCKSGKTGSTSCTEKENVLVRAAGLAQCLGRRIEQLHVVGHIAHDPPACLAGGMTKTLAVWFEPTAKFVLHGCSGRGRFIAGRRSILAHLPRATVYVHTTGAEAGGPIDFVKFTSVTADSQKGDKIASIVLEWIGFTKESVQQWATEQVRAAKLAHQETNQETRKKKLANFINWLILPVYFSEETLVFATTVVQDTSGLIAPSLRAAAEKFRARFQVPSTPAAERPLEQPRGRRPVQ